MEESLKKINSYLNDALASMQEESEAKKNIKIAKGLLDQLIVLNKGK